MDETAAPRRRFRPPRVEDEAQEIVQPEKTSKGLETMANSISLRVVARFKAAAQTRPIYEIAKDIMQDWKNVNYGAKPYLQAMLSLDKITDAFGDDSAKSIVNYFLSNARTWQGAKAKAIKTELKKLASVE